MNDLEKETIMVMAERLSDDLIERYDTSDLVKLRKKWHKDIRDYVRTMKKLGVSEKEISKVVMEVFRSGELYMLRM